MNPNKDDIKSARKYTNRLRSALRDLPNAIREEGFYEGHDKEHLQAVLQEIIGSAAAIAEICEVEI